MGLPWEKAEARPYEQYRQGTRQMSEKKCPNMGTCSMFPLLSLAGTLKTWQERYCSGDFDTCERFKRTQKGLPVAPDLMPNGVKLGDRKK